MTGEQPPARRRGGVGNVVGGFVAGLYSVPEGIGYASLAGVNPMLGIYSGMVPVAVAAASTGSALMMSTLTSAIALTMGGVLDEAGLQGAQVGQAVVTMAVLAGLVMVVLGALRLGRVVNYISNAVMTGFVMGVAILIMIGKADDIFGDDPAGVTNKVAKAAVILTDPSAWDPTTTAVGVATIVLAFVLKAIPRLERYALVLVVVAGTAAVWLFSLDTAVIDDTFSIPTGLAALPIPTSLGVLPDLSLVPTLLLGSVAVAVVALAQGAGIRPAFPNPDGSRASASRDFLGQGLGNVAGAFFQAAPTGGSLSRTAVSSDGGATSRVAGYVAAGTVVVLVVALGPVVGQIPEAVIGGLLFVIGVELVLGRGADARLAWHTGWRSRVLFALTLTLTLAVPLQWAIIAGTVLSLAAFVVASGSRMRLQRLVRDDDGWLLTDEVPSVLPADEPLLLRYSGPNFFADVPAVADQLPAADPDAPGVLVLDLGVLDEFSSTMLKELGKYQTRLASVGSGLVLVGVSERARRTLQRTGVLHTLGAPNVVPADPHLLAAVERGQERGRLLLLGAARTRPHHDDASQPRTTISAPTDARPEGESPMPDNTYPSPTTKIRSADPRVFTSPEVLNHLAKVVWQDVEGNLAFTTEAAKVAAAQTAWARQMPPTIFELKEGKLYHASGFQLCSTLIVVGDDGLIIVDPGENDDRAAATRKVFAQFSELPVKGVVYTHRHPDHAFGAAGWGVTQEQVDSGEVKIIASENFVPNLVEDTGVVGPILTQRTAYSGPYLGPGEDGWVTIGLGPDFQTGPLSLFMPNVLVDEFEPLQITIAGESMVVFGAYGDAGTDEVDLYLPQHRHVHGSETIQGETFPNLYTLRGTGYRNPTLWYKGIDRLLPYAREADTYSGSHMRAWVGNEFIVERITNYRDAIQYVHDQAVYHINRGYKLDQLADAVVLPTQFAQDPWLMEFYGTVAHSVRNIYAGLIGWFQGDATELARPGFFELSHKYVDAMGGRDQVLALARRAVDDKEFGWAAEVLTHVTRVDPGDTAACEVKAEALRQWGYLQTNIYWRTLALSAAGELDGTLDRSAPWNFADPVIVGALPTNKILETFRVRLNATRAQGKEIVIGLAVTDTGEEATYHVRNQVAVFHDTAPEAPDATVRATKAQMLQMFATGQVLTGTVDGSEAAVSELLDLLDQFEPNEINLALPNDAVDFPDPAVRADQPAKSNAPAG